MKAMETPIHEPMLGCNITSKKVLTLVMVLDKEQRKILLGYKKRGFGAHLWNGFGGKVEPGETVKHGAIRELHEEAGLTVEDKDIVKAGLLLFVFENDPVALETHVYMTEKYSGQPTECDEMRPQWFSFDEIPYDSMWEDDRLWLPLLLGGKNPFFGRMTFTRKPVKALNGESPVAVATQNTPVASMSAVPFSTNQPSNGPYALEEFQFITNIEQGVPEAINLNGTIASYE
ncbi:Nudix (Nucleoside diphosphate linked moiety X)-type motif 1 [Actinomortierella wolfii]|nr:Nudix (Nucleoside diphosphate linked moiety X)-type motif 1 [Actinomortierella wolfii]